MSEMVTEATEDEKTKKRNAYDRIDVSTVNLGALKTAGVAKCSVQYVLVPTRGN